MTDAEGRTREPQYGMLFDVEQEHGRTRLGIMADKSYNENPKRLIFTRARYKFVAQILRGQNHEPRSVAPTHSPRVSFNRQ